MIKRKVASISTGWSNFHCQKLAQMCQSALHRVFFTDSRRKSMITQRVVQSEKAAVVGRRNQMTGALSLSVGQGLFFIHLSPQHKERAPPKLAIFWEHIFYLNAIASRRNSQLSLCCQSVADWLPYVLCSRRHLFVRICHLSNTHT